MTKLLCNNSMMMTMMHMCGMCMLCYGKNGHSLSALA